MIKLIQWALDALTRKNIPEKPLRTLLDAIGEAEGARPSYWAGNPYDLVIGKRKGSKPVSEMTIKEVKEFQKQLVAKGLPSGAVGKYQFINKTLVELQKKLKFKDSDNFSPELQDKMAMYLLERRGLSKFQSGDLNVLDFMRNLSKEWASLPNPDTGKSYYGQRTHYTTKQMLAILTEV
jgi:muramidase (phage lysozyme)